MSWIGGATAVLTLVFGLQRLTGAVGSWREQKQRVGELLAVAAEQDSARHYAEAWASLKQAQQLAADNDKVRFAQENLAMEWLRDARVRQGGQTFTQLVEPLLPVIERGILRAQGQRKADLIAHVGWADFLRWRDGAADLAIAANYERAVAVDAGNPYAHAMWGHWILFTGSDVQAARRHFDAALSSGREHGNGRHLQLWALFNDSGDASEDEQLRVADEMRQKHETITDQEADRILWHTCLSKSASPQSWTRSPARIAPANEIATLRWLLADRSRDAYKADMLDFCEARAHAWAADTARALRMLRALETGAGGDATRWQAKQAADRLDRRSRP